MGSAADHTAIFLAAGRGTRMGGQFAHPKILLELHGRTLLDRHMAALRACGVRDAVFVVGHQQELVRAAAARCSEGVRLHWVDNPEYATKGNTHSLHLGLCHDAQGALIFDADLVYAPHILERFIAAAPEDALLVGAGSPDDIECAKTLTDDSGRVWKTVDKRALTSDELRAHQFAGEAMGILKFGPTGRLALQDAAARFLADPAHALLNWEHLLNQFLPRHHVACHFDPSEDWVEIDTPEDLEHATKKFSGP